MSLKNGFDMDFYLNWQGNGYSWLMRNYDGAMDSNPHNVGKAYFCKTPAPALTNSWTSTCGLQGHPQGRSVVLHHLQP